MITYSRQEMERQLVADQALWRRAPSSIAAILWPLEVALLGWGTGWWSGIVTLVALGVLSVVAPPRLKVSVYLIDLLDRFLRLPLRAGWLLMVWHLWLREPLFPVLGQPLVGALAIILLLLIITRLLASLSRLAAGRVMSNER